LTAAGVKHEVVTYPNVGHGFFRESASALNQTEVKDAWDRVRGFLHETLA
jgi:dienelactone hydrolase